MSNALNQKLVELEKNLRELSTLNEVSNSFKAILSLPQLFEEVPRGICERFGFERAVLYLVEDGPLRAVAASFGAMKKIARRSSRRRQRRADHAR